MRRAIELARRGLGKVEPNPPVGAVVVDAHANILSEGWHQNFGGPHAEIHALAAAGEAARGASLFVTLEPCCHFGKTPPCSQAVIAAGIRHVVIAMKDPAPYVDGGGVTELRAAGIEVEVGLLESEARRLVAPFVQLLKFQRPWFHAKWAMTLDGKIASAAGHSQWISNESSRKIVHQIRGRMDGILTGIGTAIADNPLLTARPAGPRIATRVVIDSKARLSLESQLVRTAREIPVLLFATATASEARCNQLRDAGVEIQAMAADPMGHPLLTSVAAELGRRRMTNVLVEGGSQILGSFFDANLIDEVHAFIAPKIVGGSGGLTPVSGNGLDRIPVHNSLDEPVTEILDGDIYVHGTMRKPS